jgi:hypothetical protein
VPWVETSSQHFDARHELTDELGAQAVLELLEGTREQLSSVFTTTPDRVSVVLHATPTALALTAPPVAALWLCATGATRRYIVGWAVPRKLHLLAPSALEHRSARVKDSHDMLMLAPASLYAQLVIADSNPGLAPSLRPLGLRERLRWSWLIWGAAQHFSGQSAFARAAIAYSLHEQPMPKFPPTARAAPLLAGSVFDLLERERGTAAAVELALTPPIGTSSEVLEHAFAGRSFAATKGAWRAHLRRISHP